MSDQIGSIGDAEALLAAAMDADNAPKPVAPEPAAVPEPQVTPDQPVAPEAEQAPDLFADADIDLSNLSPAEELRIRQMQAHFTRKTQEVAESRREAAEAVAFVDALQNDPNFAAQIHQELATALESAGLTPAQASQAAANQIQAQTQEPAFEDPDPFSEDDYWQNERQPEYRVPPEIQQQLQALNEWKDSQTAEMERQKYANQIQSQENSIRAENPTYTDADMESIYERAFAYNGDLNAAHESLKTERNRIIMSYLQQKAQVPAGQPSGAVTGQTPVGFDGDLNAAHKAAMEHLRQMEAEGLV